MKLNRTFAKIRMFGYATKDPSGTERFPTEIDPSPSSETVGYRELKSVNSHGLIGPVGS